MIYIHSSQGGYIMNLDGSIPPSERNIYGDKDNILIILQSFDVAEWKRFYQTEQLPARMDILDLGYWYTDFATGKSGYEEPAHDWREIIAEQKEVPHVQMPTMQE